MQDTFATSAQVKLAVEKVYQVVRTYTMSLQQFEDLMYMDVLSKVKHSAVLTSYANGMFDTLTFVISAEHCEVVCKGADGSTCKGANGAGVALRWKGADFLFIGFQEGL